MIMFLVVGREAAIACSQGKGACGLMVGFGESAFFSRPSIICMTFLGWPVTHPVAGSRMEERLLRVVVDFVAVRFDAVLRMDFKASLGLRTNIASRAEPYLWDLVRLACLIVSLVTVR